jgi:hypothetical protein
MLYVGMCNLLLGVVGNAAVILVFSKLRTFQGNQCAFYLIIESMSNIGLLIAVYPSRIVTAWFGVDLVLGSLVWCKIRIMLLQACGLCSVYTIALLAIDQYLATNVHYRLRQRSTLKLAHRATLANVCFVVLHSVSFLIFVDIQPSMGCTVYDPIVKRYYSYFYYSFASSAFPLTVTITFSLLAYHNVRHLVRLQLPVVRRRLDRQMTSMTLARVLCLTVCGLPFMLASIAELNVNNSVDNYFQLAIVNLITSIVYTLLYTNFSVSTNVERGDRSDTSCCLVPR